MPNGFLSLNKFKYIVTLQIRWRDEMIFDENNPIVMWFAEQGLAWNDISHWLISESRDLQCVIGLLDGEHKLDFYFLDESDATLFRLRFA